MVNTDRNGVQSDNELLKIVGDLLTIRDKNKKLRANLGNIGKEFAFELYDEKGNCNVYINDDGDITMTGVFATGTDGQARTVIDKNGIQSYDADGRKYGLWCNEPSSAGMRYADLKMYCDGKEVFKIYNGIDHSSMYFHGEQILSGGNGLTKGIGKWKFEEGASGSFETADGKLVTVSGGLITDIS